MSRRGEMFEGPAADAEGGRHDGGPDGGHRAAVPVVVGLAALASAGAALVHAAAAGSHAGGEAVPWLFAATAAAQLGWAVSAVVRPGRPTAVAGIAVNAAVVLAWLAQRTVGLPLVDGLRVPEHVGAQDLLAASLGSLAVVGAGLSIAPKLRRPGLTARWTVVGTAAVLVMAVPAMAADHAGSGGHAHGDDGSGAGHAHGGEDTAAGVGHDDGDHRGGGEPVTSLDDQRLSDDQRAAAQHLIDDTLPAMEGFGDVASVEAAGYTSIGDSISGYEHFINWSYLEDGRVLDPDAIESVVFEVTPEDERVPVSAMYMLDRGQGMDDVPDIAGELTTWHDHQDLCWDEETGTRVVGMVVVDHCFPGGDLWITPPMLHVWAVEHPCGPFAGIEGHGAGDGCGHDHDPGSAVPG